MSPPLAGRRTALLSLLLLQQAGGLNQGGVVRVRCRKIVESCVILETPQGQSVFEVSVEGGGDLRCLKAALKRRPLPAGDLTRLARESGILKGVFNSVPWGPAKKATFDQLYFGKGLQASIALADERELQALKSQSQEWLSRDYFSSPYCVLVKRLVEADLRIGRIALERSSWLAKTDLGGLLELKGEQGSDESVVLVECSVVEAVGLSIAAATTIDVDDSLLLDDDNDWRRAWLEGPTAAIETVTAVEFASMSALQKARTLGGKLPRPRQLEALDALFLDRMDETERRKVNVKRALDLGDLELAGEIAARDSPRSRLRGGGGEMAAVLDAATADKTQDAGSYDPYLDKDAWYELNRRRCMRIIDSEDKQDQQND